MKSPAKYLTDAEYTALPPKERALQQAAALVGQREQGHNAGPFVARVLAAVGLGPGFPWCASFVSYCMKLAECPGGPKTGRAAVRNWRTWAEGAGRITSKPERGDLFFWLNADQTGHIGFVAQVFDDGSVRTLEGNTNDAGSREGDGVYGKTRPRGKLRFIRL